MSKKRGSFSGGLGFVFAAAGSAVGLGNLWQKNKAKSDSRLQKAM